MGNVYIALVHYPVRGREGETIAAAITGIDLHDIARTARTYDVACYFVITPLASQREIAERIQRYWLERKECDPTHRAEALQQVVIVDSLEDSLAHIASTEGTQPLVIATSARRSFHKEIGYGELRRRIERERQPVYILFGTGWGLADEVIAQSDYVLAPIYGVGEYNHLSVRAAAAVTLDRLRGRRESETIE
jgi:hypothetical protein